MPIHRIGVVGAGTMGGGIAEAAILQGFSTILYDVGDEIPARARDRIHADVGRQVQRRRLTPAESEEALGRLALTTRLEDLNDADLIIEAAPEDLDLKRTLFAAIDRIARPDAIFASNTSSLSITALAGAAGRPERVVGMHFFNPAPVMPLVEVVARDTPGFIVNRIARPYYTEGKETSLVRDGAGGVFPRIFAMIVNEAAWPMRSDSRRSWR